MIIDWRKALEQLHQCLGIAPEAVEAINEVRARLTTPIFSVEKKPCSSTKE